MTYIPNLIYFYVSAQLWRQNDDSKLRNRKGPWKYQSNSWIIPNITEIGHIEDDTSGQVLGLYEDALLSGTQVTLEPKRFPDTNHQLWLRSTTTNGHFTFKNVASKTFLTGPNSVSSIIAGMHLKIESKSITFSFNLLCVLID